MTFRIGDFVKNIVHGFLDAGVRPVKLASCLRSKLAQHVPVSQSVERVKNSIGTHGRCISLKNNNLRFSPVLWPEIDRRFRSAQPRISG
jgi:hypothetical protein